MKRRQHCLWYMTNRMPEDERTEPSGDDLDECQPWDEGRDDPEWIDADDNGISISGNEPP